MLVFMEHRASVYRSIELYAPVHPYAYKRPNSAELAVVLPVQRPRTVTFSLFQRSEGGKIRGKRIYNE
jgi:hypothetical protein